MLKLVLLRHGESLWNRENRFTGWSDVGLSEKGKREARDAGIVLRESGYSFDIAFTSVLQRAIRTLWLVQEEMNLLWLPVIKDWRLNERHYGALQGLNKTEIAEHYGAEQVHLWRRGFAIRPPALSMTDPRHPRFDARYRRLSPNRLPATESLQDTLFRVQECWEDHVLPEMRKGNKVLIAAHGNSLRALVRHLDGLSDEAVMQLNIPTGIPLVYEFDDDLKTIAHYYLDVPTGPLRSVAALLRA
jgi:2,3-bisphosphoglycerate-dependent phosphoglycerate mutase